MAQVLIVDDSKLSGGAAKMVLKTSGIDVEHIDDSEVGLKRAISGDYELIILDLMMPKVSGKDILLSVKNNEVTKNTPVFMLTAKTDAMKWDKDLQLADKFLTKPFDNHELVDEVKKYLKCE